MPKIRQVFCHDCHAILSPDDRRHYVYQCHNCVVVEHDVLSLSRRDPDHPDVDRLERSAVLIDSVQLLSQQPARRPSRS